MQLSSDARRTRRVLREKTNTSPCIVVPYARLRNVTAAGGKPPRPTEVGYFGVVRACPYSFPPLVTGKAAQFRTASPRCVEGLLFLSSPIRQSVRHAPMPAQNATRTRATSLSTEVSA